MIRLPLQNFRELTFYLGSFGLSAMIKFIFVSTSFSSSSLVVDLDRLEVVQQCAVFECPSMILLSVSVRRIISPPLRSRIILSFQAFFCRICGLPMMILALFRSVAFSCSSSFDDVHTTGSARTSILLLILSVCPCEGVKHLPYPQ